jgi:hypothetical protein
MCLTGTNRTDSITLDEPRGSNRGGSIFNKFNKNTGVVHLIRHAFAVKRANETTGQTPVLLMIRNQYVACLLNFVLTLVQTNFFKLND